jgi:hypothetical protein
MPGTLLIAEILEGKVRKGTFAAIAFAKALGAPFSVRVRRGESPRL